MEELHTEARRSFKAWVLSGRKRHGPLFKHKRMSANFKYALRFIKRNEDTLRSNSLANKLQSNSVQDFNRRLLHKLTSMVLVAQRKLLECDRKIILTYLIVSEVLLFVVDDSEKKADVVVSSIEIYDAIRTLKDDKACVMDNIC